MKDNLVIMAALQCHAYDLCEQYEFFNLPKTKSYKQMYKLLLQLGQER